MSPPLEAALRYAGRGWPVFPCRARRKVPLTAHGLKDATTDADEIRSWWRQWPDANVAVRTGSVSGLVVIDVDGDDGVASLRALEREHCTLPRTASVVTPRGGQHFYLAHPGVPVSNSAGRLGAGLDVRGEGGYVVAPPSIGPTGRRYEPDERAPLAPAPWWLVEHLSGPESGHARTPANEWISIVRDGLPEGQRNAGLARLVGHLLRRYVDPYLVAELAHLVNRRNRPALDADEVDRIVKSIARRELQRRKGEGR